MEKIKILIVDDHALYTTGLSNLLNCDERFEVIGVAANGQIALEKISVLNPDIILLDLEMPVMDGEQTAREIVRRFPKPKCIMVTMHEDICYALELLKIGVYGYVPKKCDADILYSAIATVHNGEKYISENIFENIDFFV